MNLKTIKKFILGGVLLFGMNVWTSPNGQVVLSCTTEPFTTSYLISEEQDRFDLLIFHHNGMNYMPLHSGTITPNDLPMLTRRAENLKKMGDRPVISFKKSECRQEGILWRCYSNSPTQIGGLQLDGVSFTMGHMTKNFDGFEWSTIETFLHLDIKGDKIATLVTYSFPEPGCRGKSY